MAVECSPDSPCTTVQLLSQRIEDHRERMDKIDKMLEHIQNRPPVWASLAISGLAGGLGLLAGHIR